MKKITLIVIIGLFLIPLAWAYDGSTEGQPPYDPDLPPCILIPAYCENVQPNPIDALSQSSYYWAWNTTRTDIPNGVQTNKTYYIIEKKAGTPTELLQIEASSWYTGDYKEENSNCWEGLSLFGYQKHHETVSFNLFTIRTIGSQVKFLYKATKNVTECWKNPWDIYPTINTYSEVFEGERFVRSANCKDTGCPTNQYCDTVSGNCVKCLDNTHCSAPTPACNQSTQTCVECTTDAHCFIGVCDASTFSCVCPPECDIDPSTVACGQQLVPQSCLQHEPVCDWPDPLIGWKCNDIDERCANHENQNKCWSPNEIDCGTEVVPYIPNPDTMMGLYCDDFQNESHKLCDTSLSTPACLPVLKKTEYPLKYLFNVSVDPEWALWYNIWFKFRFDTADEFPQILQHDTDHPEQTGLYCFGCSVQPDSVSAFSLFQEPTAEEDKEGLIRFYIGNNNLFGPLNYARIKLQDKIDPTKGDSETEKTDFAILKLNAGYSGHCVSEDRTIRGETGIAIAPKVKYDWSWGNQGYKLDFCSPDHPVPTYCDSTQFAIALFDRLEEMRELYALGQEDEATALKDFEVLLMQDGFSEDFLLDFDHYMMNIVGFSTKSWFKDTWTYYLQDTSFLLFNNKTNPSNPLYISEPGHYSVHLQTNWQGSEGFFLEGTQPIATITVNFEEKIADPIPQNPLYFLPIDARIGETVRLGETTPNR
ncbi:hypothetical protein KKE06_01755 [Candidatus Micrarchaeota archaeon]|nr:hypothetical protein [Candidatus Micrarchaeota archaeon]MBU1930070.1 hypothetical protein [Candidatus Micrarchaeota archaeon]